MEAVLRSRDHRFGNKLCFDFSQNAGVKGSKQMGYPTETGYYPFFNGNDWDIVWFCIYEPGHETYTFIKNGRSVENTVVESIVPKVAALNWGDKIKLPETEPLKSCPFCGETTILINESRRRICDTCGARGPAISVPFTWNDRC